jgi:2-hydroxy-6-oxonona-2,4-dienedioate hydrolase
MTASPDAMIASTATAGQAADAGFLPLAAVRQGAGPSMVLLHGGVGSSMHWARNTGVLAQRFSVTAFDLPGYGNSPDVPKDIASDAYVDWVAAVVAAASDRCHLVGFSFGGALAARVATKLGDKIIKLSLLGAGGFGAPVGRVIPTISVPGPEAEISARRAAAASNLGQWMLSAAPAVDDPVVDQQLSNIDRTRFNSRRVSHRATILDDLPQIAAPVQFIWGAEDKLAYPSIEARAEACRAVRADIGIAVVPDGGHWIQFEQADRVNRLLMDFHGA